ncbi:Ig-like domain-containing protein [Pontibacter sp. H259]|uniref:Ig-like domain-containing protein n=1 Tax=Pontibacter sp. H259 TaxID=3133421 RepID=UPI0030C54826
MKIINTTLVATTILTLASCASVSSPEGGARDTTSPTLVSSNPKDQQLNVATNTLRLEFDEEVQQNNLQKELLITPFTENKYKIRINEKVMELVFDQPLQDSTTYTFNFRNGIADITEKNIIKGLRLSFSTGSYIDSSKVAGNVLNLLTQQPEKEILVGLYPAEDTMNIRKSRPFYQTQTDANGAFTLENIKEGNYRIYALADKNTNNIYDNEAERVGFLAKPIIIKADSQKVTLQTFIIDTKKPVALQRTKYVDRFTVTYSEGIEIINARTVTTKDTVYHKLLPDGKTLELFKSTKFTGGKTLVTALDSAGNSKVDTIQVDFGTDYTQRLQGANIKVVNKTNGSQTYRPGQKLTIELQGQVSIKGNAPIAIKSDTVTSISLKYPGEVTLDKTQTELTFTIPKLAARQQPYTIVLDSTQILPVHTKPIRFPELPITIAEAQGSGSLKGNITTNYKAFTVQLLDGKYNVVKEQKNNRNFQFRDLTPGLYQIRIMVDENNNGKWDRGSGAFDKEPEKVYLHPTQLEIRANWELEDIKIQL